MKWMILGGDGQLGRCISKDLASADVEFISISHSQLDITNQGDIEKWFANESPNVVVNAAAWTNVDLAESDEDNAFLVNALGPKLLAQTSAQVGAKFVQISSDYVFSGRATSPWRENDQLSPVSAYGRTKAAGERFVQDVYPSGSYIVRTAWLYSPWGKNFVKTVMKIALQENRNIEVVSDQIGQPTSAMDLASQIKQLISQDAAPGIYHGTNSGQASWFELAQRIFASTGEDQNRVIAVNSSASPRPAKRPNYSVLGQDNWALEGLTPMRNWQVALQEAIPTICQFVKQGE